MKYILSICLILILSAPTVNNVIDQLKGGDFEYELVESIGEEDDREDDEEDIMEYYLVFNDLLDIASNEDEDSGGDLYLDFYTRFHLDKQTPPPEFVL